MIHIDDSCLYLLTGEWKRKLWTMRNLNAIIVQGKMEDAQHRWMHVDQSKDMGRSEMESIRLIITHITQMDEVWNNWEMNFYSKLSEFTLAITFFTDIKILFLWFHVWNRHRWFECARAWLLWDLPWRNMETELRFLFGASSFGGSSFFDTWLPILNERKIYRPW